MSQRLVAVRALFLKKNTKAYKLTWTMRVFLNQKVNDAISYCLIMNIWRMRTDKKVANLRRFCSSVWEDETRSVAELSAAVGLNWREIFSICPWDLADQITAAHRETNHSRAEAAGRTPRCWSARSAAGKHYRLRCRTTTLHRLEPPPGALP
jgi:hypothetical protein